jgi:hypothetical protein
MSKTSTDITLKQVTLAFENLGRTQDLNRHMVFSLLIVLFSIYARKYASVRIALVCILLLLLPSRSIKKGNFQTPQAQPAAAAVSTNLS